MTHEQLLREITALPPEEVASLLRQLLELVPALIPNDEQWAAVTDDTLARYRTAWERLADV